MAETSVFQWERGGVHLQGDQLVRPGGDARVAETYKFPLVPRPEEDAGKPACLRFASLGDPGVRDESILEFANRYGLLGFSRLDAEALAKARDVEAQIAEDLGIRGALEARVREKAKVFREVLKTYNGPPEERESLRRWRSEAASLAHVVAIIESLSFAEEGRVEDALLRLYGQVKFIALPSGGFHVWEVPVGDTELDELAIQTVRSWSPEQLATALKREAARLINQRLVGRAQLIEYDNGHLAMMPFPVTLLEALYVQLAFLLFQQQFVRICADPRCGRAFVPNHGHQRYCSVRCRERVKKEQYRRRKGTKRWA